MQPYPHVYTVTANGAAQGLVPVAAHGLTELPTAPPPEFDGPGDVWSPETLLVAAIANCFIFTFRAVARANGLEWTAIETAVDGTLEKIDGVTRFSKFATRARLRVPAGTDEAKARRLLERAEHACLIANSLVAPRTLDATVLVD